MPSPSYNLFPCLPPSTYFFYQSGAYGWKCDVRRGTAKFTLLKPVAVLPGRTYAISAFMKMASDWHTGNGSTVQLRAHVEGKYATTCCDSENSGSVTALNLTDFTDSGSNNALNKFKYYMSTLKVPLDFQHPTIHLALRYVAGGLVGESYPDLQMFMDDLSIQLADGHAGATMRRCNYNLDFMGKNITLLGASRDATIIDCGLSGQNAWPADNEPRRGLIFVSGETSSTSVEKLTVRGCTSSGKAHIIEGGPADILREAGLKIYGENTADNIGSAVIIRESEPSLRHIHLLENKANYAGGAVSIVGDYLPSKRLAIPEFVDVSATSCRSSSIGGVLALYRSGGLKWTGGNIVDCEVGGGTFASGAFAHMLTNYQKFSHFSHLNFTNNRVDIDSGGRFGIFSVKFRNRVIISDNFFHSSNYGGEHARDIWLSANNDESSTTGIDKESSVVLVNNIHQQNDANVNTVHSVVLVLNSCDEVVS